MKTTDEPVKLADAKLLATLKRYNPAKLVCHRSDDEAQAIAVPVKRRRWVQVIAAITSRQWLSVDLLDKGGALLFSVENTEPARDLEALEAVGSGTELRLAERIVALVMKGQRDTMAFRDAEVTALLRAQGDVLREMSNGMRALSGLYQEQVLAQRDIASMRLQQAQEQAQASGGGDDFKQLLEALPTIMQAVPLLKSLLSTTTAPPNGARKVSE